MNAVGSEFNAEHTVLSLKGNSNNRRKYEVINFRGV